MELIKITLKSLKFLLTMCSDKNISSTYLNHTKRCKPWVSRKTVSISSIQKTCVGWDKLGPNSGARYLLLNLSVKLEVDILQKKICYPYQFTRRNSVLCSLIKHLLPYQILSQELIILLINLLTRASDLILIDKHIYNDHI